MWSIQSTQSDCNKAAYAKKIHRSWCSAAAAERQTSTEGRSCNYATLTSTKTFFSVAYDSGVQITSNSLETFFCQMHSCLLTCRARCRTHGVQCREAFQRRALRGVYCYLFSLSCNYSLFRETYFIKTSWIGRTFFHMLSKRWLFEKAKQRLEQCNTPNRKVTSAHEKQSNH